MSDDCIDPPPGQLPEGQRARVAYPDELNGHEESGFPIRKALISDVQALLGLVNDFASQNLMLPRGPQYLFENIRDFAVIVDEARQGQIVACGSLHVLWEDMAEVRAMAIHPAYQKRGLGRRLVEFLKQEAVQLGIACSRSPCPRSSSRAWGSRASCATSCRPRSGGSAAAARSTSSATKWGWCWRSEGRVLDAGSRIQDYE
jgi:amino-acid N-acetyltransferase